MSYTIKDIAKQTNVSIATVSRIINNQGGYSEKTKRKVLNVIEELGYQPNAVARGLVQNRTQTIGVLVPDVSSMLSSEILNGIEEVAHSHDSSVIICHTAANGSKTMRYLQLLNEKRIDGIIFTSEYLTKRYYETMKKMRIPIVLVSTESDQYSVPSVKVNDKHAAYSATNYLIEKGHKNVGMLSGNQKDPIAGKPRIEGYEEALHFHDISECRRNIVHSEGFGFRDGYEGFKKLYKRNPHVTAIFAASDEMALGAISAAYKMGINVPNDLSVIGYDNIKAAEMSIPPLTTVAQPLYEMGATASKLLFNQMEKGIDPKSQIMPHKIIERESVQELY